MFLSKRNAIYYLFYSDDSGKRRSRSTGVRTKPEAVEYLRTFNVTETTRRRALKPITLSSFQDLFESYSKAVHTSKTTRSSVIAIRVFSCFIGPDVAIHTITPGDCERFLASKVGKVSPYTLRYYFLAPCASFERAFTWSHIQENPWRKVKKPKTPQVLPAYFTREQFPLLLSKLKDRDLRELVIFAAMT